ncbi:hypothetical protein LNV08_13010 [Paucibacter sp. TC2R-5]|uniref:hypothetical protein n=1 Tax=Paucibacter sp. TC2R-5 TaxID=2893555 RepID=UPI0021E3C9BA|nr:hypothetical protein [Paucibacter sp. TC2R-5]MCV2359890.1 hypothetical protein [Paucibacter sp. TC2R-5]
MNTRQPTQLLTTCLTALGAIAASAVLGMNLAAQADQAASPQQVEQRQARELTAQTNELPKVLIEGRRQV